MTCTSPQKPIKPSAPSQSVRAIKTARALPLPSDEEDDALDDDDAVDNGDEDSPDEDDDEEEVDARSRAFFAGKGASKKSSGQTGQGKKSGKAAKPSVEDRFFKLDEFDALADRLDDMDELDIDLNRSDFGDDDEEIDGDVWGDDDGAEVGAAAAGAAGTGRKKGAVAAVATKKGAAASSRGRAALEDMDDVDDDEEADDDAAAATYADFFGDPGADEQEPADEEEDDDDGLPDGDDDDEADEEEEEDDDDEEDDDIPPSKSNKAVKGSKGGRAARAAAGAVEDGVDGENDDAGEKSEYQLYTDRMAKMIAELEGEAVAPKAWLLQGETSARERPTASLLETHLEYDTAAKIAAPITEESTAELETLIKQRIRDQAFDDVVRKVDVKDRVYRPPTELNQEKSKLGLAEIYEQEFVAQSAAAAAGSAGAAAGGASKAPSAAETALSKEHAAISELFAALSFKLDALSNFHYTPRAAATEASVQPLAPAIAMEEVLPMGVSDAQAKAPQEVRCFIYLFFKSCSDFHHIVSLSCPSWSHIDNTVCVHDGALQIYRPAYGANVGASEATQAERQATRRAKKAAHQNRQDRTCRESCIRAIAPNIDYVECWPLCCPQAHWKQVAQWSG